MLFKKVVFCLMLLFVLDFISEAVSLTEGGTGVCVGKISSKKMKKVYYTRYGNKWCGKKKCTIKASRSQPYTVMTNVKMCCKGWQYDTKGDRCTPLCTTGCVGGSCVAPETCRCDPPTYLDPSKNTCKTPECDPPCSNATCIANNSCQCHDGFEAYNTTHCQQICQPGYASHNIECLPNCETPCTNGKCAAPNTCSCDSGFVLENNTCVPYCKSCVNSECLSPDTCSCLAGYVPVNSSYCEAKCTGCGMGVCVSPNKCQCTAGFVNSNGTCEPVCDRGCLNGVCSGPNMCDCNEGYQKNFTNSGVCFKPCLQPCPGICTADGDCRCEKKLT